MIHIATNTVIDPKKSPIINLNITNTSIVILLFSIDIIELQTIPLNNDDITITKNKNL